MKFKTMLKGALLGILALASSTVAMAEDLDALKTQGEMRIALSGAFPPFSLVETDNSVVGFDVDIGKEIASRIGVKPTIITTAWDGIIPGLLSSKYDAIVGSMSITEQREKAVDFAGPYYHTNRGIFVPESSTAKSLDDLKDKVIGVALGETNEKWARDRGGWEIRTYKGLPEMLLEMRNGRLDAIVADDIPVFVAIKQSKEPVRQIKSDQTGDAQPVGIAIRKGNPALKEAINAALKDMFADGTYAKISDKWIGQDIR